MYQDLRVVKDVEDLRRRVWLIEQRLGMAAGPETAPTPEPVRPARSMRTDPRQEEVIKSLMTQEAPPVSRAKSRAFSRLVQEQSAETVAPQPLTPPQIPLVAPAPAGVQRVEPAAPRVPLATLEAAKHPVPQPRSPKPKEPKPGSEFNIERLIGGRWYAWIGALAVVVGLGLFFKYAYDQHWLRVPPGWRCILGAGFGFSLLATGEVIKRKINAAAAAGIFAAGIGSIYASVFAAYRMDMLPHGLALILLAGAAAIGVLMGARARLVSVTIVSLIGGYLAPFLMDVSRGDPAVVPMFLLSLMAVGLTLSAWLRGPFSVLRALTWWATILIGGVWTLRTGTGDLGLAAVFLGLTWIGVHTELFVLARRGRLVHDDPREPDHHWKTWRPLISSFSTTAWTVLLGVNVLDAANVSDWLAPAALFAGTAMAWLALAGNLTSMRDRPRTDSERLGVCLGVQSAGLLIATISLAMGGWGEVVAWLALGVTSMVAGKWLRARAFDIYGIAVLAICAGRLLLMDSWMFGMASGGLHVAGFVLTKWAGLMAVAGAAWIAMAFVVRPGADQAHSRWRSVSDMMVGVGIALLGGSLFHSEASIWTPAVIAAATAVAMVLAGRFIKAAGLGYAGLFVQVLAVILTAGIQWWNKTPGNGVSILGFYIVPAALAAPFVGLTWLITPRLTSEGRYVKNAVDAGIAVCLTMCFAPLLHVSVHISSLAAAALTWALATMGIGHWRRSVGLSTYGVAMLACGTIATLATNWWSAASWVRVAGIEFGPETLVAVYAAAAWLVSSLACLRLDYAERDRLARLCFGVAMALFMGAACHVNADAGSLCLTWLAISVGVGAARRVVPRLSLDLFMLAALVPTSIVWIAKYGADWNAVAAPLVLHPGLGMSLLLAGAWLLGTHWCARTQGRGSDLLKAVRILAGLAALGLVFASTSLEVARVAGVLADEPRVKAAAVSIWWGIFGVMLITAGFWKRVTAARHAGLGLMGLAMFKAMILDLQGVPQLWRIASFIGLGLLMLGVAVVYSRVSVLWNERLEQEAGKGAVQP